jgi:hypothetical protein
MADVQTCETGMALVIIYGPEMMYGNRSYKDMQLLSRKFLTECKIPWWTWKTFI